MFAEDLKRKVNEEYEKSKIPLKMHYLELYRPTFKEPPFEQLEIVNNAKQLMVCNSDPHDYYHELWRLRL